MILPHFQFFSQKAIFVTSSPSKAENSHQKSLWWQFLASFSFQRFKNLPNQNKLEEQKAKKKSLLIKKRLAKKKLITGKLLPYVVL